LHEFIADCEFRIAMSPEDLGKTSLDELGKKWGKSIPLVNSFITDIPRFLHGLSYTKLESIIANFQ
jgi:hypothetical protein